MENFVLIGVFVMLGILLRRIEAFPRDTPQVLNMFALYVSLPALILLKAPHIAFSRNDMVVALVPWGMLLFSMGLVLVGGRLWHWPRSTIGVLLLVVPLGNTSFMGVPVIQAFFGTAALSHLIIYDQVGTMLIFATYGSVILSLYGRGSSLSLPTVARRMLLFPPTIALVIGLACRPWLTAEKVAQSLQSVALTLVPLVMTAIGFQLRVRLPHRVMAPLGFGLGIKLIAAPLAVLLTCRLIGATGQAVDVSIVEAGMPPMVTASALAVIAGMEAELAVALAGVGIILSFGTLPLLYWLIRFAGS
ncbi:MAG TPA: AEC family transporter [Dongiaceae bacterium]|nr:AEC family transporter [Dongiaceae bacterium]